MLPKRPCDFCSRLYVPYREGSKYCSRICQVTGKNQKSIHPDVTLPCAVCGKQFVVKYGKRKTRKTCSGRGGPCARKLAEQKVSPEERGRAISAGKIGKTHRGVPHSEETKRILSEKTRLRMSNPETNPFVGKKRSVESRERQSRTRAARFVDGTYKWKTWTEGGYLETIKAGKIWCRSSWEKKVAEQLDHDPLVKNFEVEPFSIPYRLADVQRHYVPDFLVEKVDGTRALVEVKPKCHVDAAINVAKFAAAREHCEKNGMDFEVWTQDRLAVPV